MMTDQSLEEGDHILRSPEDDGPVEKRTCDVGELVRHQAPPHKRRLRHIVEHKLAKDLDRKNYIVGSSVVHGAKERIEDDE